MGWGPPRTLFGRDPCGGQIRSKPRFPLEKKVVFPYAESGVWTSTGVANSLVSGGAPTPHRPFCVRLVASALDAGLVFYSVAGLGHGGRGAPLVQTFVRPLYPKTVICLCFCVFRFAKGPSDLPRIGLWAGPGRSLRFQNRCSQGRIAFGVPGSHTKSGPGGPPAHHAL